MHVILATHNKHKIKEISDVIKHPDIKIESLLDYPDVALPPETGTTFLANARVKARTVFNELCRGGALSPPEKGDRGPAMRRGSGSPLRNSPLCKGGPGGIWILADDSGLCVDALNGRPGIYSSRYSGEPVDYARNNKKLLGELKGVPWEKRTAHFICSMVLIDPSGKEHEIEGRVNGHIAEQESSGKDGFGYDPVFYLSEYKATIAELPLSEKNKLSHRGLAAKRALEILIEFLDKRVM